MAQRYKVPQAGQLSLTAAERQQLFRTWRTTADAKLYRRLLALVALDRGHAVEELIDLLEASRATLYAWRQRYLQDRDPLAVLDRPGRGRPGLFTEDLQDLLDQTLALPPQVWGYRAAGWTIALLCEHLATLSGRPVTEATLGRFLRMQNYSFVRKAYRRPHDSDAIPERHALLRQIARMPKNVELWAVRATPLRRFSSIRLNWTHAEEAADEPEGDVPERRVIFWGLNLQTGERLLLTRQRNTVEDFAQFLLLLRHLRTAGSLALLLDDNKVHNCPRSAELASSLRIKLFILPKRRPSLNPTDLLNKWAQQTFCAPSVDADLDTLAKTFTDGLHRLSPQEALRKAGIFGQRFWLRSFLSH